MTMSPAPTSQVLTVVIFNLWVKGSCAMMVAELDFHMDPECKRYIPHQRRRLLWLRVDGGKIAH